MKPCFACGSPAPAVIAEDESCRVQCNRLECQAAGPKRESPEAAELAWNLIQRPCLFAREVVAGLWAICRDSGRTSTVKIITSFAGREGGSPSYIGIDRIKLAIDEMEVDPWGVKQGPRP